MRNSDLGLSTSEQPSFFGSPDLSDRVAKFVTDLLGQYRQPSARELLFEVEKACGLEARWDIFAVIQRLSYSANLKRADREYLRSLMDSGSLDKALRGEGAPDHEVVSTIDSLLHQSRMYRSSGPFKEMVEFMGLFRHYAPYNNMLVRLQDPTCSFYATERDWRRRFHRELKEDAQPMLILAPKHPVMLVYDLDQTYGKQLPEELRKFSKFEGEWVEDWLNRAVRNAASYRIRVNFKPLSSTQCGFATLARAGGDWKMRIAVHNGLDAPSRFGVLCHELAHILLGHLGTDRDHWWPGRSNMGRAACEIEAESVAFIVTSRLGLQGSSATYVSRYLGGADIPAAVSLDSIAKVAGQVERMARELIPPRRPRPS